MESGSWASKAGLLIVLICWMGGFWSCTEKAVETPETYLLKIGESTISLSDFEKALETAKVAYPHNMISDPGNLQAIQLRLLKELSEQLLLTHLAGELDISVSDAELKAEVAQIKKDYPDDVFEDVLLENAISYPAWEQQLKVRMLMEKVIDHELGAKIRIQPEEIVAYYRAHPPAEPPGEQDGDDKPQDQETVLDEALNQRIIAHLRRMKAESLYQGWMDKLKKQYPIEINQAQWRRILGINPPVADDAPQPALAAESSESEQPKAQKGGSDAQTP